MKKKYCRGSWEGCARYMVLRAKGKAAVPQDLFPGQKDKAEALIAG
jgi:hypothetical protein